MGLANDEPLGFLCHCNALEIVPCRNDNDPIDIMMNEGRTSRPKVPTSAHEPSLPLWPKLRPSQRLLQRRCGFTVTSART